jgi:hypothetical protein
MDAGHVIARTTVQQVTNLEQTTDEVRQRCQHFDQRVTDILNDANHIIPHGDDIVLQDWNDLISQLKTILILLTSFSALCLTTIYPTRTSILPQTYLMTPT